MPSVLVTGATGFVGTALIARLARDGCLDVRGAVRSESAVLPVGAERVVVGDVSGTTDWRAALRDVTAVVHLAARVHVLRDAPAHGLGAFRRVNVDGTLNVARQAAAQGVDRFVFLSSVKVNGERGFFREIDNPAPEDPYGISKCEAENGLRALAAATGLRVAIIRAPLVYGPGVKANFQALMSAIARGVPLPLGAVKNQRSLVALDNLVDFLRTNIDHPAAANETFFVSDGEDLSTTELIHRLARAMQRPARLIPVPPWVLNAGATLLRRRDTARRLLESLQVDISKARQRLGWTPPITVDEGLRRTVAAL